MIQITPQRQAYFDARGKVILNACPGSGKTTCIAFKLPMLQNECSQKFGDYAGIACLSFTNIAKSEIIAKYKKMHDRDLQYPHVVSTIDSFINQFITLPFFSLIDNSFKRPKIVDDDNVMDNAFKSYYIQNGVRKEGIIFPLNTFKNKSGLALFRSYPVSSIWVDVNGQFTSEGKLPSASKVDPTVFQQYGAAVLKAKLKKGLINSLDSSYIALQLLKKYDSIGLAMVKRFPFLIIDEAQDNSEIQHAIFDKLIFHGLENIEMVGDPYQSLYEWRDAKPKLLLQKFVDEGWKGLPLSQNRRSVQRIIDCFSIVRSVAEELITTIDVDDLNIPLHVYKYNDNNLSKILADFEEKCKEHALQKNHIVVRGNTLKDKILGNSSEINPWKTTVPIRLLRIRHEFERNEIKDAVDELRKLIIELQNPDLSYGQVKDLLDKKKEDHIFNGQLYAFLYCIPEKTLSLQTWSTEAINELKNNFAIDATNHFEFKKKIDGYKMVALKGQAVELYFNKSASRKYNFPVTTIHQVKGATLDALLYIFNEQSTGQMVSFNDFKPSISFPTEKQRIIYVACSRPSQFLALGFPEKISDKQLTDKFGDQIKIISF